MGVYSRFKKSPTGLRQLVELWETTPLERRKRMIEVGMEEDPDYTQTALALVMTFQDVLSLEDMQLTDLLAIAPPRMSAFALSGASEATRARFLKCAPPKVAIDLRDYLGQPVTPREVGGAKLKLVEKLRELERKGLVKFKRIPL